METYLFDFDGTLVDSMSVYERVMLRALDEHGVSYPPDIVKILTPLGLEGTEAYLRELGLPLTREQYIDMLREGFLEEYYYRIPAKPHVVEVLQELKRRGAELYILTAGPHITLDACLKRLGIYDLFTQVWSCEDFGTTKSDPDIYVRAAEKIGKPVEDILFLDDNLEAGRTAKQAGMRVCGVYDESSKDYADEIQAVTDRYIYDFSELL